jgi:uncharacterized membrane protein YecN with MAPEG domain
LHCNHFYFVTSTEATVMITLEVTGYTAIALTLLMIPLAMNVSMRRFTLGKAQGDLAAASLGDAGDKILQRRIRAFGNLIEYAPMCVILLALLENTSAPAHLLWTGQRLGGIRTPDSRDGHVVCTKPSTKGFRHGYDLYRHADSGVGASAVLGRQCDDRTMDIAR